MRQISIGGQSLQVAIRHGAGEQPPLLLFNGIGANWELAKPFLEALTAYDGDHLRRARGRWLSACRRCHIGHRRWRGLPPVWLPSSATARSMWPASPGAAASRSNSRINIRNCAGGWCWPRPRRARSWCPPSPSVLWKMATPRRYTDKDYMSKSCSGNLRRRFSQRSLIDRRAHERDAGRSQSWVPVSASRHDRMDQPAVALVAAAADARPDGQRRSAGPPDQRPYSRASHSERAASDD